MKRTTKVDDCPKTELGNAFRVLARGGAEGQKTIAAVAERGIRLTLTSKADLVAKGGSQDAVGLTTRPGGDVYLMGGRGAAALAFTVAHEVGHVLSPSTDAGWNAATSLYRAMPSTWQTGGSLKQMTEWRERDPEMYRFWVNKLEQ